MKTTTKNPTVIFTILGLISGFGIGMIFKNVSPFIPFLTSVCVSLTGATLSFFLDFSFNEGNIFAFWFRFLNKYFYQNKKNPFSFLYSPLGGCLFCMNIWVTTVIFAFTFYFFGLNWVWWIPATCLSHFILNLFAKYLHP